MKFGLLLFNLMLPVILLAQDETKYIKLTNEKTPLHIQSFQITAVHDDRTDTSGIGIVHGGLSGKREIALKMQPGLQASLQEFIRNNFVQDTAATPVELHIDSLHAVHTRSGLKYRMDLSMGIAFYTNGEKITDYNGSGYAEGVGDPSKQVEELIRNNLQYGMQRFDEWWTKNKNNFFASVKAPLSVVVEATMATVASDSDYIIYSPKRPLILNDFIGSPDDLSLAAAVTFSGIQLKYGAETVDGHVKVKVQIIPYFNKPRSWCRKGNRNAKTLLHEQKHFDLTALKACELLDAIRRTAFTANFEQELNRLHNQNEKEWDQLQREYDTQTKHGTIASEQQKWNKWIQEELAKRSCFN